MGCNKVGVSSPRYTTAGCCMHKDAVTWQVEAVCPWPCQYTMAVGRVDIVLFPECLYFWSSVRGQESVT